MNTYQQIVRRWGIVLGIGIYLLIASALTPYPELNNENILIALRLSSLTTAIPLWLIFITKPMLKMAPHSAVFLRENRRSLWLIATISHFIHLYQITLYYRLGNSCPLVIWLITSPLWIFMILISSAEILLPQLIDDLDRLEQLKWLQIGYTFSVWYIWLMFTLAFVLGSIGQQLLFYNLPASILFVSGAFMYVLVWWQKKIELVKCFKLTAQDDLPEDR